MRIAQGGMGQIELVLRHEGRFHRLYAWKRLYPHLAGDRAFRAMFMDEARLAGLIRHPNVLSVLDVGEDAAGLFLLMEFVDGLPVARIVEALGASSERLPLAFCLEVLAQAARGLHAAHELASESGESLGLVHRDVSPHNLLVGHDGVVRVTDFGVAKAFGNVTHTSTGILKGNVGYMAPECLRFEPADRRADLFSLGVVLHEMLTGRRLYDGPDAQTIARRVLGEPPPDLGDDWPDAPPALVELLFRLLAKDPAHRPATAAEVGARADELCADLALTDGPFDLARFMEARFGEERAREATVRAQAVREALVAEARPRVRARRIALGAAVALGIAALLGAEAARRMDERALLDVPHGLLGQYFDDVEMTELRTTRVDPQVQFDWSDEAPDPAVARETYAVRWTGRLLVPAAGPHRLCVRSDDGARLWIDGVLIIDKWILQPATLHCATLPPGRAVHAVKIEYFQNLSLATVKLLWGEGDDTAGLAPVPTESLLSR